MEISFFTHPHNSVKSGALGFASYCDATWPREENMLSQSAHYAKAVTLLSARTTAQLQVVEQELIKEKVMLEHTEEDIVELEQKEDHTESESKRTWQADNECSNCTQTSPRYVESYCFGVESIHGHMFVGLTDAHNHKQLRSPSLKTDQT
ncbi:protein WWC3-like isoform X2 [Tamandua tetradactyla]|uniref:protein WWC3-like isoform X2 n=1 Tax=Tamandua tetradactyla TaxID=48850 RepID=UPI00405446B5